MIIDFKIKNFGSFKGSSLLDFRKKSKEKKELGFVTEKSSESLLTSLALVGVNGSGKTTLLKGLHFMKLMVLQSQDHNVNTDILYDHFRNNKKPIKFEIKFIQKGKKYFYGFSYTNEKIEEEFAYVYETAKSKKIFTRTKSKFDFGRDYEKDLKEKSEYVIPKTLMVSRSVQLNSKTLKPIFDFFEKIHMTNFFPQNVPSFSLLKDEKPKKDLLRKLYSADLSIEGLELVKLKGKSMSLIPLPEDLASEKKSEVVFQKKMVDEEIDQLVLLHKNGNKRFKIDFSAESSGTKKFIWFFYALLDLSESSVILYDEIENSLNVEIIRFILDCFKKNKSTHQLIFTTHQPDVLNHLRSDQIKIIDKEDSESKILELYDIVKSNEKINKNYGDYYKEGVLGGFPNVYNEHED